MQFLFLDRSEWLPHSFPFGTGKCHLGSKFRWRSRIIRQLSRSAPLAPGKCLFAFQTMQKGTAEKRVRETSFCSDLQHFFPARQVIFRAYCPLAWLRHGRSKCASFSHLVCEKCKKAKKCIWQSFQHENDFVGRRILEKCRL